MIIEPVRTELRLTKRRGIWRTTQEVEGKLYWALWRPLTVGWWRRVSDRNSPHELSERCWRKLLIDTNLVKMKPCWDTYLSDQTFTQIMKFWPSFIPVKLLSDYLKPTQMTAFEESTIEKQCLVLWNSNNGRLDNPPEYLPEALEMMAIQGRYGIPGYRSIEDIPYRLFVMLKIVNRAYGIAQDIKTQMAATHQRALNVRRTGVIPENEQSLYRPPES